MEDEMNELPPRIENDLGHFEGFSFTRQCAIETILTANEVLDYSEKEEAEFWPAGDNDLVRALLDSKTTTSSQLIALDALITSLGEDRLIPAIVLIGDGYRISDITEDLLDERSFHHFEADNFLDARKEAAYQLFELYWPEAYKAWETGAHPDGLYFDADRFLDSPQCSTTEIKLGERRIVLVEML